ncbi:MAG: hypothetical protein IT438_08005 [Phycisphaerales bacterium]|nr:hypothetical protein [Phycisphaerales bacterium]
MDATLRTELGQWSAHYWNRVETGAKIKVGDFAFSNAALNNPLFNPLRGARATLEQLSIVSASACDGLAELQPGWGDAAIASSFKAAMKDWTFTTDSQANPSGTSTHMSLITASGAGWTVQGNLLISTNLPLEKFTGANNTPTIPSSLLPATQAAITKLIDAGSIIAAASAGTTEAQSFITGEESHATKFERGVQQLLADGGWRGETWRVDAAFGVFGSLPLVGVTFRDACVLLNSVTGALDGPFSPRSPLVATALLASHPEYTAGTSIKFFASNGCKGGNMAGWVPVPCTPPALPGTCIPATFVPVTVPGQPPGNPGNWVCDYDAAVPPATGGTCTCHYEYKYASPLIPCPGGAWVPPMGGARCLIIERWTCASVGGATCIGASCPGGIPAPAVPPPANPIGAPCGPIVPCTSETLYWAM